MAAIRTSGDALLALINDILDLSKIKAGQLTLEVRPFDLRLLVGEVVGLFTAQAPGKGLERWVPTGTESTCGAMWDQ